MHGYAHPYSNAGYNTGYSAGYGNSYGYNAYAAVASYAPSVVPNSVTSTGLGTVNPANFNAPEVLMPRDTVDLSFDHQYRGGFDPQDVVDIAF